MKTLFRQSPLLAWCIFAAAACPAYASLDGGDNDGMSDIWEEKYGFSTADGGTHFPKQGPNSDPDGDGLPNLEESQAGTDPMSGCPSQGLFEIQIAKNPLNPLASSVGWHGVEGKVYQLWMSPDLASPWVEIDDPVIGIGDAIVENVEINIGVAPRVFWRVEAGDIDTDEDGISDYEEAVLGLDSEDADENGNGIPDGWEMTKFGALDSAPDSDYDGDGSSNLEEYQVGSDPRLMDSDGDGIPDGPDTLPCHVDYEAVTITNGPRILTPNSP